ncbi:hypothetical protein V8C26DRAFT_77516 [Trichoderma gracile]
MLFVIYLGRHRLAVDMVAFYLLQLLPANSHCLIGNHSIDMEEHPPHPLIQRIQYKNSNGFLSHIIIDLATSKSRVSSHHINHLDQSTLALPKDAREVLATDHQYAVGCKFLPFTLLRVSSF